MSKPTALIVCAALAAFTASSVQAAAFAPSDVSDLVLWLDVVRRLLPKD